MWERASTFSFIRASIASWEKQWYFSYVPGLQVGQPELSSFVQSYGHKVIGIYRGSNPQTQWWTSQVTYAIKLKENNQTWWACKTKQAVHRYQYEPWPWWLLRQKLGYGWNLVRPWKVTLDHPQRRKSGGRWGLSWVSYGSLCWRTVLVDISTSIWHRGQCL